MNASQHEGRSPRLRGFTLVEMLVGAAISILLVGLVLYIAQQATNAVRRGSAKIDSFRAARTASDLIQTKLSQATLNTYWDYYDASGLQRSASSASGFRPHTYGRASDLHFLIEDNSPNGQAIFFQAPLSASANAAYDRAQGLMNACGFFVQFGGDGSGTAEKWRRPAHVGTDRYRYRLMQGIQAAENRAYFSVSGAQWTAAVQDVAWPIADNVICLVVWPRLPTSQGAAWLSEDFLYDSRSTVFERQRAQLPPVVELMLIVIDEASATRLENGSSPPDAIASALAGRFLKTAQYESDLEAVKHALTQAGVNYTILSGSVLMRESKWSSTQ